MKHDTNAFRDLFPTTPRTVRTTTQTVRHGLASLGNSEWKTPGGVLVYRDEHGTWNIVKNDNVVETVGTFKQAAAVAMSLDTSGQEYCQSRGHV